MHAEPVRPDQRHHGQPFEHHFAKFRGGGTDKQFGGSVKIPGGAVIQVNHQLPVAGNGPERLVLINAGQKGFDVVKRQPLFQQPPVQCSKGTDIVPLAETVMARRRRQKNLGVVRLILAEMGDKKRRIFFMGRDQRKIGAICSSKSFSLACIGS